MSTISPPERRTKICGRCRTSFICCAGDCWCTTKWVPIAVLEAISRDYTDCLCAQCLDAIVAEHGAGAATASVGQPFGGDGQQIHRN